MRDPPTFPFNLLRDDKDPFFLLLRSATDPPRVSLDIKFVEDDVNENDKDMKHTWHLL